MERKGHFSNFVFVSFLVRVGYRRGKGASVSCHLLESERRGFNVMLALQRIVGRCLATGITMTKGPGTKNVGPLIVH